MHSAQYIRVETKAGGIQCTDKQFIRSAHSILSHIDKRRELRDIRHAWLRGGLSQLEEQRQITL